MNIQISYFIDSDRAPKEMARKLEDLSSQFHCMAQKLQELAKDLVETSKKEKMYEMSEVIEEIDDVKGELQEKDERLGSFLDCLVNFAELRRSSEDKKEIIDEYGPEALQHYEQDEDQ